MEEKEEGTTRSTITKRDTLTADTTRTRGDPTRRKALRDTILSHLIRTSTLTMRKDPSLKDTDQITTLPTVMLTKETQDTLCRCLSEKETSEMAHHHLTLKMDILLEAHLQTIPVRSKIAQVSMLETTGHSEWTRSEMNLLKEMTSIFHLAKILETNVTSLLILKEMIEDESSIAICKKFIQ